MQEKEYTLTQVINSLFVIKENKIKKRLIYNNGIFGRISSKWIKFLFLILPFVMYAAVFNPISFEALGIAQAIVFYIILLVMAMQVVIGVTYFNNKKVLKIAIKSWEIYFPEIDLKMILSAGATPYVKFKHYYEEILKDDVSEEVLKQRLEKAFEKMEEENCIMVEVMKKDRKNKAGK